MQDRYVGDIGDFGKYAFLRHLCAAEENDSVRLAIVWCLFDDEKSNNDGKQIGYLRQPEFAELDPPLLKILHSIVFNNRRAVSAIADRGCFAPSTIFFDDPISPKGSVASGPSARIRHRNEWFRACLSATKDCKLIFLDPDNGMETPSVPKHHRKAGKYIYWDEVIEFWSRGHTLVIYHHLNRTTPSAHQVHSLQTRFGSMGGATAVPLVFRRGSARVFWLIHRNDELGRKLETRAAGFLRAAWSRHFRPLGWPGAGHAVALT